MSNLARRALLRDGALVVGAATLISHNLPELASAESEPANKFEGLESAATPGEAGAVHASGNIAVWRPSAMASDLRVAASWDVTSDSLAAVYAHQSGAARLLLIKSVDVDTALDSPSLVDPCFASHAAGLDVFIAGPAALDGATEILSRGGVAGSRVFLANSSRKIAS